MKTLNLDQPKVMGILNVTPDSFYNKGRGNSLDELLKLAERMIMDGAEILDIGGQSSRPASETISTTEELNRVIPLIEQLHQQFPDIHLSVDTYRHEVAQKSIEAGVHIINDISGGELDHKIIDVAIDAKATYICMHMQGTPQTMQLNPHYDNIVNQLYAYFERKIQSFAQRGLEDIIIDVGFGFGKTLKHNYTLLKDLSTFESLGKPILVGISRKSMVYKPINSDAENALNGTTALHMFALQNGAKILRVHDVKEAKEVVYLHKLLHGN